MKIRTLVTVLTLLVACAVLLAQDEAKPAAEKAKDPVWLTSLDKAMDESEKTGKPILSNFTGSDWCGWCIRLKKEVFNTPEFKAWARGKVVLLEVDFPRNKPQSAETKKKNRALATKYDVQGFPTIVFTDAAGKELGRSGYMRGGPKVWTAHANKILAAPKKRRR